uniref:cadherin-related family member 4 n=1 Tax=Euleptes europaea TaxID=460621 RepID=UPI0025425491|nr:cadherin-related family member 4 [Euleptes europaea]
MGSEWHLHLALLLTIWSKGAVIIAVEFIDLPRTVKVDENVTSGVVASFTVNCTTPSSNGLNVTLDNILPPTTFFNSPNALGNGTFQVTLGPGTTLNAREVNQYILTFTAVCPGNGSVTSWVFIQVKKVDELQCDNTFLNTAARPLVVPENVAPEAVIYTVTLKKRGRGNLTFAFENASVPFTINSVGEVCAPATGFTRTQADKLFQINIVVRDSDGRSCCSFLVVQVQPVYHNTVNFTESSTAVSVFENTGPLQTVTQVHAHGEGRVLYQIIYPTTVYFTIDSGKGKIKNTYNLDLDHNPELANTLMVVEAYNMLHPTDRATITVNITVQRRNQQGPVCHPAIYVTEIPETSPIGMTLSTLSCVDKDSNNRNLQYQMNTQIPPYSFRMERNVLQVNTTLDCDSAAIVSLEFLYQATILVTDSGSPQQTTTIPVLVTVSRVNEYKPECPRQFSFSVPENAAFGKFVGNVNGTDRDYPFNKIEYSILGAEDVFYVGRHSGDLYVLGPLDYEKRRSYLLTITLKDLDNDVNTQRQYTTSCNITINVQNVNDMAPVCAPDFETHTIYSTLASNTSIMSLQCFDEEEGNQLIYTIVGGNTNGRFRMVDNRLSHNTFSYNRDGIFDPLNYELLVKVTDSRSTPCFSTTATIIIHVIPWTTTVPTTIITTTVASKKPIISHRTEEYWAPDPWFVVVLTFTGILLLSALGLLFWRFCCRKVPTETFQPLLQNRGQRMERNYIVTEEPSKEKEKVSAEVLNLQHHFDGRTQDPVTGQFYLFDSSSGARRWV